MEDPKPVSVPTPDDKQKQDFGQGTWGGRKGRPRKGPKFLNKHNASVRFGNVARFGFSASDCGVRTDQGKED